MRFAFLILYCLSWLPHSVLRFLARILGFLGYWLVLPRRRIGLVNLRLCFPKLPEKTRRRILRHHFFHMTLLILEFGRYWYTAPRRLAEAVDIIGRQYLDEHLSAGRRVVILYPHFTAFEAAVYALNQTCPLIGFYSPQKNPLLDAQILRGRNRFGNVSLINRTGGIRALVREMRNNPAPYLCMPDQDLGRKNSVFVPFFGVMTATVPSAGRIAALTDAVVVPAWAHRTETGRVVLEFFPAWQDEWARDAQTSARKTNEFIEQCVLSAPEQYFWLHKRFKTRPEGETSPYAR